MFKRDQRARERSARRVSRVHLKWRCNGQLMRNEVPTPGAPKTTFYHKITENHKNGTDLVRKTTVSEPRESLEFPPRGPGFRVKSPLRRFSFIKRKQRMRGSRAQVTQRFIGIMSQERRAHARFQGLGETVFKRNQRSRERSARRASRVQVQ